MYLILWDMFAGTGNGFSDGLKLAAVCGGLNTFGKNFEVLRAVGFKDAPERSAVDRTGAVFLQGGEVIGAAISLVMGKAISGILRVVIDHQAIARYFGDDRRGGDRKRLTITAYDRLFGEWTAREGIAIDEHAVGRDAECGECLAHGVVGSVADVVFVYFLWRRFAHANGESYVVDGFKKFCSAFFLIVLWSRLSRE